MKLDWGEEEEESFQKLKEAITEAPLLVYPKKGVDLYWIRMLQIKL